MPEELPKTYDPAAVEEKWAKRWADEGLWRAPSATDAPNAFTMLLPPPNVTGRLHMGHMLNQTEMDILARWRRMRGEAVVWVPGTDHAGIATQMMVERQLAAEGTSREALGRERFTERVWAWREEYGGAILDQMKRLGASVDWSREYFTMDEGLSRAVREAFVRLHEQGLIYRGKYIVNWDPVQQTAVSDLEVTHEERVGKLYHVRYPLADGSRSIVIATTRPETMLGDTAVAVNPSDARYAELIGKTLRLPLSGLGSAPDREIPVLADTWANPEFGTGAVKVTPAHDPNDFAIGERHSLPQINIMDAEARIDLPGSPYHGLDRYAARERIVADLEAAGLLVEVKDHPMSVGLSQRTGAVIEPRLSTQWFLRTADFADENGAAKEGLAKKAIEAVEQGFISFTPEQYKKTYLNWMENIHDWCISRQLWWGHRIPAWHCAACSLLTVAQGTPPACSHCGAAGLEQDPDVLDTWFSSGLLPFSVFGWPEKSPDLEALYPTSLLVTGSDILFFWVARMVMLGCWAMHTDPQGPQRSLENAVPFKEVYIHALVRDADRQKMSKTKGNVIDPVAIVNQYGTDAVRFTLASMASPGTDIAFNEQRTEGYRAFANKIWNAARFVFMQMHRASEAGIQVDLHTLKTQTQSDSLEARFILSQLGQTARASNQQPMSVGGVELTSGVDQSLENYRFDNAAGLVYAFFWMDFCDYYLEHVKIRLDSLLRSDQPTAARPVIVTLLTVFEGSLRLLSPFMPFLTEELWNAFYEGSPREKFITNANYPNVEEPFQFREGVLRKVRDLQDFGRTVWSIRKEQGVPEKAKVSVRVHAAPEFEKVLREDAEIVKRRANVAAIEYLADRPEADGVRSTPSFDLHLLYEEQINPVAEQARIEKERIRLEKELARLEKAVESAQSQLHNQLFLSKAPEYIVSKLRTQLEENSLLLAKIRAGLDALVSSN